MAVSVGDGANAPALGQAQVAVAMGAERGIALEGAGVLLLRQNWTRLPEPVRPSPRAMVSFRTNLVFTLAYKPFGLLVDAAGLLPPSYAAATKTLPDVITLGNPVRLLRSPSPHALTRTSTMTATHPKQSLAPDDLVAGSIARLQRGSGVMAKSPKLPLRHCEGAKRPKESLRPGPKGRKPSLWRASRKRPCRSDAGSAPPCFPVLDSSCRPHPARLPRLARNDTAAPSLRGARRAKKHSRFSTDDAAGRHRPSGPGGSSNLLPCTAAQGCRRRNPDGEAKRRLGFTDLSARNGGVRTYRSSKARKPSRCVTQSTGAEGIDPREGAVESLNAGM